MMQASGQVDQYCSLCGRGGRVRCCVCKSWYCTAECQANHWPVHRRECVPLPGLEWPDGSRYGGQLEDGGRSGQLEIEHISDEESTSMKDLTFVGRKVSDKQDVAKAKTALIDKKQEAVVSENDEKISKASAPSPAPPTAPAPVLARVIQGSKQTKQPDVDIRAKPSHSAAKPASKSVEPVPVPVKPVTTTEKPVPTSAKPVPTTVKLVSNASEPVPTPAKLVPNASEPVSSSDKPAQTSLSKIVTVAKVAPTPVKPAAVSPNPVADVAAQTK